MQHFCVSEIELTVGIGEHAVDDLNVCPQALFRLLHIGFRIGIGEQGIM